MASSQTMKKPDMSLDIGCGFYKRGVISVDTSIDVKPTAVADAQNLPFKSKVFDYVYIHQVLEHVQHPSKVLKETYRVLRPRGLAEIGVPHPALEKFHAMKKKHFQEWGHMHVFTDLQLRDICSKCGFEVLSVHMRGPMDWIYVIAHMILNLPSPIGSKAKRSPFLPLLNFLRALKGLNYKIPFPASYIVVCKKS